MATVKQAIADLEKTIRVALQVSDKAQIQKLVYRDGEYQGQVSDDGQTWYKFIVGKDGAEIFE